MAALFFVSKSFNISLAIGAQNALEKPLIMLITFCGVKVQPQPSINLAILLLGTVRMLFMAHISIATPSDALPFLNKGKSEPSQ